MEMADCLLIHRENGLTRLTLNRAEKANALSPELTEALLSAFAVAVNDGTRLVLLQGAGKSFCSGFDLSGLEDLGDADLVYRTLRIETLLQAVYHAPFPTLALAHGNVFGAGADLLCSCSRRIADPAAKFRMPGLAFGIVLGTRRLAARIGQDAAREIQNGGRSFDAHEAAANGFVNEVAEQGDWPEIIEQAASAARILPAESTEALFRVTALDTRAEDMAELVASAGRPGLKERIKAYREQTRKAAGKK